MLAVANWCLMLIPRSEFSPALLPGFFLSLVGILSLRDFSRLNFYRALYFGPCANGRAAISAQHDSLIGRRLRCVQSAPAFRALNANGIAGAASPLSSAQQPMDHVFPAACDGSAASAFSDCVASSHAPDGKAPAASSARCRAHRCGPSCKIFSYPRARRPITPSLRTSRTAVRSPSRSARTRRGMIADRAGDAFLLCSGSPPSYQREIDHGQGRKQHSPHYQD